MQKAGENMCVFTYECQVKAEVYCSIGTWLPKIVTISLYHAIKPKRYSSSSEYNYSL